MLSFNISIRYKNRTSHGNPLGGLLTIIIGLLTLIGSIYFSLDIFNKQQPKSFLNIKFVDDAGKLRFDSNGLLHFIYVRDPSYNMLTLDKRALNVTGIVRSDKGVVYGYYLYDSCNIEIDFDNQKELFLQSKDKILFSVCPRYFIDSNGKTFNKSYSDSGFKYPYGEFGMSSLAHDPIAYTLSITKCVNSTENRNQCYPEEKISQYYTEKYFALKFIDNYFDITSYQKPVNPFINTINGILGPQTVSNNWLNFIKVNIASDDGAVFESKREIESYKFDYRVEIVGEAKKNDVQILNVNFYLQNMSQFYYRSYIKLQDVCANIGGMSKFLLIGGTILNYLFHNLQLMKDFYSFLKNAKIKSDSIENTSKQDNSKSSENNKLRLSVLDGSLNQTAKYYEINPALVKVERKKESANFNYLPDFPKVFSFINYLTCRNQSSTLIKIKQCMGILLDENTLLNNYLEVLKLKSVIMEDNKMRKKYEETSLLIDDILLLNTHDSS